MEMDDAAWAEAKRVYRAAKLLWDEQCLERSRWTSERLARKHGVEVEKKTPREPRAPAVSGPAAPWKPGDPLPLPLVRFPLPQVAKPVTVIDEKPFVPDKEKVQGLLDKIRKGAQNGD